MLEKNGRRKHTRGRLRPLNWNCTWGGRAITFNKSAVLEYAVLKYAVLKYAAADLIYPAHQEVPAGTLSR